MLESGQSALVSLGLATLWQAKGPIIALYAGLAGALALLASLLLIRHRQNVAPHRSLLRAASRGNVLDFYCSLKTLQPSLPSDSAILQTLEAELFGRPDKFRAKPDLSALLRDLRRRGRSPPDKENSVLPQL